MDYENVSSIKSLISNHIKPLLNMYKSDTKYAGLPDEELERHFGSEFIPYLHKLPKVTDTLKYKGKLRISWALDVKYNKNIDLIFFTEDNPFINYAVLYAKGSPKLYDDGYYPRDIKEFNLPYDINYDFVKEVLKQSSLSPTQQEKFFNSRFGSVLIPMEIEFEWYSLEWDSYNNRYLSESDLSKMLSFFDYDEYLRLSGNSDYIDLPICLGIIKSYKILPPDTSIIFPKEILDEEGDRNIKRPTFDELLTPLPTSALAFTYTDIDDFIVNVRDKPSAKEGKIVTQLLSQVLSYKLLRPTFERLGQEGLLLVESNIDSMNKELESHYKTQQVYYEKEKSNLINPLNRDEYIVLVWNIESNGWAKVWILRERDKNSTLESYKQIFLEQPSRFKLYEGYIHTSGLGYYKPFGENYIQR